MGTWTTFVCGSWCVCWLLSRCRNVWTLCWGGGSESWILELFDKKFWNSRVRPSTLPRFHLVRIPHDKNTITSGRCFTVLDSSLPCAIVKLFISCTNPSSNLDPHLSQGKVWAIPPQLASFLRVSTELHTRPAFTSHMVNIYATQIALGERMREIGWQQEATQFKSKQKVKIYNFWEPVSEFEGFTHCHDIN